MGKGPRAILLVADISGYTAYVRNHARSASHARQITVRLLEAIVAASGPPLAVAELEGDAVFFYALGPDGDVGSLAERVKDQIPRLFRAFAAETRVLTSRPDCTCSACTGIGDLRLKQVVHTGEVAVERIAGFRKLFGLPVIVVHRMLKNALGLRQYLMLSETAFSELGGFFGLEPRSFVVDLEGVGEHRVVVIAEDQLASLPGGEAGAAPPSLPRVLRWKLARRLRTVADMVRDAFLRERPAGEAGGGPG